MTSTYLFKEAEIMPINDYKGKLNNFALKSIWHYKDVVGCRQNLFCGCRELLVQVSLALLMMVRKELLAQDFEGIMKYFRVNIPKRLRSTGLARENVKTLPFPMVDRGC